MYVLGGSLPKVYLPSLSVWLSANISQSLLRISTLALATAVFSTVATEPAIVAEPP